jgi:hypothetical protein
VAPLGGEMLPCIKAPLAVDIMPPLLLLLLLLLLLSLMPPPLPSAVLGSVLVVLVDQQCNCWREVAGHRHMPPQLAHR